MIGKQLSVGNSAKFTILALLRDVVVFVPASILLASVFGSIVTLLWAAMVSDVISAMIGFLFVRSEIRKLHILILL